MVLLKSPQISHRPAIRFPRRRIGRFGIKIFANVTIDLFTNVSDF